MPLLLSALLGGLLELAGSMVGRVILSLGLGFVEYQGVSALVSTVTSAATGAMANVEGFPVIAAWAGFFRIDVHVTLIISAIGVKIALNAMGGASIKKLVSKG